ncbi:hypothetical protein QVD17_17144 [Tagetes erecta]|uniref:Uncharacterized protein n=1 Tax=Tagetes erecta TaxID=13708 RepID=A0AAD8P166_TARER|nr:hypothetical protein QVD17_16793 [Tagetes erecta]KAK1428312.1 hypothetical protein QVD17_17144 [Tagetes erecta]
MIVVSKDESGQLCLAAEETKQLHKQIEQQLKLQVTLWQPVMGQVSCRWFEEGWIGWIRKRPSSCINSHGSKPTSKDGSDGSEQLCLAVEETKQLHKQIEQQLKQAAA